MIGVRELEVSNSTIISECVVKATTCLCIHYLNYDYFLIEGVYKRTDQF